MPVSFGISISTPFKLWNWPSPCPPGPHWLWRAFCFNRYKAKRTLNLSETNGFLPQSVCYQGKSPILTDNHLLPLIHCASLVRSMSLLCETKHLNWCGFEFYGLPLRVLPQADLSAVLSLHCFYVVCGVKTKAFVVLFQRQGFQSAVIETERLMLQSTSAFLFGLKFQEPPEASKGPSKGSLKSVRHLTLTGWRHMHTHTYIVGVFQSQVFILLWAHGTKAVTSLLDYTNCCTRVLFQPLYFDWMSILEREVHQKTTTIIDR